MRMLELGRQFRPATSHVYPPFKKGMYMEEFMYQYLLTHEVQTDRVYIPVFWTNLQNHPGFVKDKYNLLLQHAIKKMPPTTKYVTVVQHDDGPQLQLPKDTIIFGACTGTIPLPLIYEDTAHTLEQMTRVSKTQLASFVGTITHPIRREMVRVLSDQTGISFRIKETWSSSVPEQDAVLFVEDTLRSKFCLAPRGYGRSSFRFFEAMLLDTVPVYFWDDQEWLPYQDIIDYRTFSLSISKKEIGKTYEILSSISDEQYGKMVEELQKVRSWFTLEGMATYVVHRLQCAAE